MKSIKPRFYKASKSFCSLITVPWWPWRTRFSWFLFGNSYFLIISFALLSLDCPVTFCTLIFFFFFASFVFATMALSAPLFQFVTVTKGQTGCWQGFSLNWHTSALELSGHIFATAKGTKTQHHLITKSLNRALSPYLLSSLLYVWLA